MAIISGIRRSFGTLLRIKDDFLISDLNRLSEFIYARKEIINPIFLDVGELCFLEAAHLDELVKKLLELKSEGFVFTLINSKPELDEAIRRLDPDRELRIQRYMDEAIFPGNKKIRTAMDLPLPVRSKPIQCPYCKKILRDDSQKCLYCGGILTKRRNDRYSAAFPFFYSRSMEKEFFGSQWIGAVTEDIDIKSFTGLGFFSQVTLAPGEALYLVFPTLPMETGTVQTNPIPREKQLSTLNIFVGRVKHSTFAGEWFRIGIAFYDLFEYTGKFEVITEVNSYV